MRRILVAELQRQFAIMLRYKPNTLALLLRPCVSVLFIWFFTALANQSTRYYLCLSACITATLGNILIGSCFEVHRYFRTNRLAPIQLAGINEFALYFSIAVTQLITQVLVTIPCAVLFLHGNSVAHLSRFLIGIVTLATISIMLAITLCVFTHHFQSFRLSTTVTGILLLLSGSLYPTAALPNWIQPLSYLTPLSYSLDLVRNGATGFSPTMLAIFPEIALGIAATVVTTALTLLSTQRNRHYCPRKLRIPKNRGS